MSFHLGSTEPGPASLKMEVQLLVGEWVKQSTCRVVQYDEILVKRVLTYSEIGGYKLNCCNETPKVAFGFYTFSERRDFLLSKKI